MGTFVTGVVSIGTLVVIAGIIYQVVTKPNSVPLAKVAVGGVTSVTSTLFKG
jgi:hypothetical protein